MLNNLILQTLFDKYKMTLRLKLAIYYVKWNVVPSFERVYCSSFFIAL